MTGRVNPAAVPGLLIRGPFGYPGPFSSQTRPDSRGLLVLLALSVSPAGSPLLLSLSMTLFRNVWGPKYAGFGGQLRKMGELALQPGNYPFIVGGVSAFLIIGGIPITGQSDTHARTQGGGRCRGRPRGTRARWCGQPAASRGSNSI